MSCNPTRLELSNTDATTVDVTLTTDPGDGTAVVLEVPGLSISETQNTSGGEVSYTIAARTEDTHSLWDGTIQVGANAPADIVIHIVETSAAQTVGLTVTDADVSYCAPLTSAGVESLDDLDDVSISLPVAKQVLYYNGTIWRNVSLSSGDIPSLDASKITSGTFDDLRISSSSVTQYAGDIDLNDLGDVNIATGAGNDGDLLFYDHASGAGAKFKGVARSSISLTEFDDDLDYAPSVHTHALGDLSDVDTAGAAIGQVLEFDGADWVPATPAAGGGTDYIRTPASGTVLRFFDDMLWSTAGWNTATSAQAFYCIGGQGAYVSDAYAQNTAADGVPGVIMWNTQAQNYKRLNMLGPEVYNFGDPDGTGWLFEARIMIEADPAAAQLSYYWGAVGPKNNLDISSSSMGGGIAAYGDVAKAGNVWSLGQTFLRKYYWDTEGTSSNSIESDITSVPLLTQSTWYRVGVHCYKATIFSVPTWVVDHYLDGTLVSTQYLTSNARAPVFFLGMYQGVTATVNKLFVDWVSFQYTRNDAVTMMDITDL
jgi:hypothetical protein